MDFWADEYVLDAQIAEYPKPVIAVMDGIVMGGGLGISMFAAARWVTERSKVAMPETKIGFFPDVAATYLLSRAPGELGTHLATTDLKVVYTLPETDSASGKRERWTQARAAADTTMKVSEVMERDSSTIEVYFWSKDNPDFQPQLLKDDFDRRCPAPR